MTLWLIGGVDPSGGAGLLRDYCTAAARAPELRVRFVVTAQTWQGWGAPARFEAASPASIVEALAELAPSDVAKLGLVPEVCVDAIKTALAPVSGRVIVDPVLGASDGGNLGATPTSIVELFPCAELITPNRIEAATLVGADPQAADLLESLRCRFEGTSILLKDGHGADPNTVTDQLWHDGRAELFTRGRIPGADVRGTGCALATAIACERARGRGLLAAVAASIAWLDEERRRAWAGVDGRLMLPQYLPATDAGRRENRPRR